MREEKLIEIIKEDINTEELRSLVNDVNSWNGGLDSYEVYDFDEDNINTMFKDPFDALRSATFGEVSFNDEYFRFNGYGNIETISEYSLEQEIKENAKEIIESWLDNCYDEETIKSIVFSIEDEELDEILKEYNEGESE